MHITFPAPKEKSRLAIVFETFVTLGVIMTAMVQSIIPLLGAGVLFCVCALNWRTEVQRQKYHDRWIALALCLLVAGIGVAAYFRK